MTLYAPRSADTITISTGGNERTATFGELTDAFRAEARWDLTRRVKLNDVSPLWRFADGKSLAAAK